LGLFLSIKKPLGGAQAAVAGKFRDGA